MSIDFIAIISVAFLSSFGHCYSMCGGFNLAFLQANSKARNLFFLSFIYQNFRILAYMFLGLIFGTFGTFLAFNAKIQSLVFFILGVFMIFLGFALLLRNQFLFLIENNIFFNIFVKKVMKKTLKLQGLKSAMLLGFANGFVPCGLVYFFLASAISKTSVLEAVLIMFIFGISTLPAMLFFVKISQYLNVFLKKAFNYLSYIIIILYGINLAYMGFKAFRY